MPIKLKDIMPIENPCEYKVHFARFNKTYHPLDVWIRNEDEWREWQEYRPSNNAFNRRWILSLMQFYHEDCMWLFGGVFEVIKSLQDRYVVQLTDQGEAFIGRLKLYSPYNNRATRVNLERQYESFDVHEILREPYSGQQFPGYDDINISFADLETINRKKRPDWTVPLTNIKGVYLISVHDVDVQLYVGAAYGNVGIWSRWCQYIDSGHGGNVGLCAVLQERKQKNTLDYCRKHFRFSLLEAMSFSTPDEAILAREKHWKNILSSRIPHGLNCN